MENLLQWMFKEYRLKSWHCYSKHFSVMVSFCKCCSEGCSFITSNCSKALYCCPTVTQRCRL